MILQKYYMDRYTISYLARGEPNHRNKVIVYMYAFAVTTKKKKEFLLYSSRES